MVEDGMKQGVKYMEVSLISFLKVAINKIFKGLNNFQRFELFSKVGMDPRKFLSEDGELTAKDIVEAALRWDRASLW